MAAVKVYEEGVRSLVEAGATPREGAAPKALTLYHCVYSTEKFNDAAHALFDLVAYAHRTFPGAERHLFVDIEGHRMPNDAFDGDMFELQKDFLLGYLMHFLYPRPACPSCTSGTHTLSKRTCPTNSISTLRRTSHPKT